MTKKDDKTEQDDKRVLGTGAKGDPEHPEVGVPVGAPVFVGEPPVTEVHTQRKDEDK